MKIELNPTLLLGILIIVFAVMILLNKILFHRKYGYILLLYCASYITIFIDKLFFPISIFYGEMREKMWQNFGADQHFFYVNPIAEAKTLILNISSDPILVLQHIIIMIPLGILINELCTKKHNLIKQMLIGFICMIGIECIQIMINYMTHFKQYTFSLSEIIVHFIGLLLGILIWYIFKKTKVYVHLKKYIVFNENPS